MTQNTGEFDRLRKETKFDRFGGYDNNNRELHYTVGVFAPGAKCPNHACRMYLTDQPGKGICEISGAYFDYDEGPYIAGDNSKNSAKEFEIRIVNGKYRKVLRTSVAMNTGQTIIQK